MKQTEIEKLSAEDILDKLEEFKKKLNDLRMTHSISPLENPIQIRDVRRSISRLLTAKNANK
jgi:large subunit ribosomal protein L29